MLCRPGPGGGAGVRPRLAHAAVASFAAATLPPHAVSPSSPPHSPLLSHLCIAIVREGGGLVVLTSYPVAPHRVGCSHGHLHLSLYIIGRCPQGDNHRIARVGPLLGADEDPKLGAAARSLSHQLRIESLCGTHQMLMT